LRDPTLNLWLEDEVHFQQHGSQCQMWIPHGKFVRCKEKEIFNAERLWVFFIAVKKSQRQIPSQGHSHSGQREVSSCETAQGMAGVERR
jgi:hypothetical protein